MGERKEVHDVKRRDGGAPRSEEKTPEAEEGKEEHDPGKCESDLTHGKS